MTSRIAIITSRIAIWLHSLYLTFWIQHHCHRAVKAAVRGNIFREIWHTERMYKLINTRTQLTDKKVNNYVKLIAK